MREILLEMAEDVQEGDELENEDVQEFSGVGAVAGFTAPLGMSGDDMRTSLKKRRKKA